MGDKGVGESAVLARQNPKTTRDIERSQAMIRAWEMYVYDGKTQTEIARELGVTQRTVSYWLREAQQAVIQEAKDVVTAIMLDMTSELQRTIQQIDAAIQKTMQDDIEETEEESTGVARTMNFSRKQRTRRSARPDARLFEAKVKAMQQLADLWGIGNTREDTGDRVIQSITVQKAVISPEWAAEMAAAGFSVDVIDAEEVFATDADSEGEENATEDGE